MFMESEDDEEDNIEEEEVPCIHTDLIVCVCSLTVANNLFFAF